MKEAGGKQEDAPPAPHGGKSAGGALKSARLEGGMAAVACVLKLTVQLEGETPDLSWLHTEQGAFVDGRVLDESKEGGKKYKGALEKLNHGGITPVAMFVPIAEEDGRWVVASSSRKSWSPSCSR